MRLGVTADYRATVSCREGGTDRSYAPIWSGAATVCDALAACEAGRAQSRSAVVHACDQVGDAVGQGTVARVARQARTSHAPGRVGGRLIGGIAAWCAGKTRVIGVEHEAAPTTRRSRREARRPGGGGIAATPRAPPRRRADVQIARSHIARVVIVTDAQIRRAKAALWARCERGRAGGRGRLVRPAERRLRAGARRARRRRRQRGQHDRGRLRSLSVAGGFRPEPLPARPGLD